MKLKRRIYLILNHYKEIFALLEETKELRYEHFQINLLKQSQFI